MNYVAIGLSKWEDQNKPLCVATWRVLLQDCLTSKWGRKQKKPISILMNNLEII